MVRQERSAGAGVVIGRFQTPRLHSAHLAVLHRASWFDKMIVLLGCNSSGPTRKNPMDFQTREAMIHAEFPEAVILPVYDMRSNKIWSEQVDRVIARACPFVKQFTLLGGRDSFATCYKGRHAVAVSDDEMPENATEMRLDAAKSPVGSIDFRAGVIYGVYNQYPIIMPTVDVALIQIPAIEISKKTTTFETKAMVLMGRKKGIEGLVLPGGFIGPKEDPAMAAVRELEEETGMTPQGGAEDLELLDAMVVDNDWRSKRDDVNLMTLLYMGYYASGRAEAADDLDEVSWENLKYLQQSAVALPHRALITRVKIEMERRRKRKP